jgi:subtilisin family serine protease
MAIEFMILRDLSKNLMAEPFAISRGFESLGGPLSTTNGPPEIKIEKETLSSSQVLDISRDPEVRGIAPSFPTKLITPLEVKEEGAAQAAWGIGAVRADISSFSGDGVTVAVLDTGIDENHEAFKGVDLIQMDFSGSGDGDPNGHGTHCAGTIFGRDVDSVRIGVARGVEKALIGKVLDDDGSGSTEMILNAINWATLNGANVISMSLGFDFPGLVQRLTDGGWPADLATSLALEHYRANIRVFDAMMGMISARAAFGNEIVVVAAAGNENYNHPQLNYEISVSLPAAAQGIISTGAAQEGVGGYTIGEFSNTGPVIAAPGVNILSAKTGGGLASLTGTSMACPHVAGVAALTWEELRMTPTPSSASNVTARLRSRARSGVFAVGVEIADRGVGMVTAPQ